MWNCRDTSVLLIGLIVPRRKLGWPAECLKNKSSHCSNGNGEDGLIVFSIQLRLAHWWMTGILTLSVNVLQMKIKLHKRRIVGMAEKKNRVRKIQQQNRRTRVDVDCVDCGGDMVRGAIFQWWWWCRLFCVDVCELRTHN